MRVFLDTNVLIDYLARRQQFYNNAALIISECNEKGWKILVSALSFATASYILFSHHKINATDIKALFENFIKICNVTPVDSMIDNDAVASVFDDLEDAMKHFSALRGQADVIITRNKDDFDVAQIPVMEPQEFLDLITE